jgi:exonuclease III
MSSLPHSSGMRSATIASININGLSAHTRVGVLHDFIRCHDLDIVFLQEVLIRQS